LHSCHDRRRKKHVVGASLSVGLASADGRAKQSTFAVP